MSSTESFPTLEARVWSCWLGLLVECKWLVSTRPCYSWVTLGQENSINTALLPPPTRTLHRSVGQDRPVFSNSYIQRPSTF